MPSEYYLGSLKPRATDDEKRQALIKSAEVLKSLGVKISARVLAKRASRSLPMAPAAIATFISTCMTNEERAALGIKNAATRGNQS